jgi:hypothetical protein
VYELNYKKNGELDTDDPVHVFWIRYTENGQRAELNFIQRYFAYGIKAKLLAKDYYELQVVAYKKQVLYLRRGANNRYYVYTSVNNKQMIVDRIYLKINGGSFWSPNVEYVEFKGLDISTGAAITEQLKIES